MKDSIRSLERIFLTSAALMVLWALLYPTVRGSDDVMRRFYHAHAWLALLDLCRDLRFAQLEAPLTPGKFQRFASFGGEWSHDLQVHMRWPTREAAPIALVLEGEPLTVSNAPADSAISFYRVEVGNSEFPFSDYAVVISRFAGNKESGREQRGRPFQADGFKRIVDCVGSELRSMPDNVALNVGQFFEPVETCLSHTRGEPGGGYGIPFYWKEIDSVLAGYRDPQFGREWPHPFGFTEWRDELTDLAREARGSASNVEVLGVPLPARTFVACGTVVLFLVAVWAIGPLRSAWPPEKGRAELGSILTMRTWRLPRWRWFELLLVPLNAVWCIWPLGMGYGMAQLEVASWWVLLSNSLGVVVFGVFVVIARGFMTIRGWPARRRHEAKK